MPERLSDDLLQKLRDSFMVRSDSTSHGVILAIDELLALRAQLAAGPVMPETPSEAARDVLAERRRQVEVEGWTPEHDDAHSAGEMARAAVCYALTDSRWRDVFDYRSWWPWSTVWWKPTTRRRDLVKAGALILAEIERIDRAALAKEQEHA